MKNADSGICVCDNGKPPAMHLAVRGLSCY